LCDIPVAKKSQAGSLNMQRKFEPNTSKSNKLFIDIEMMITRAQGQDYKSLKLSLSLLSILQHVQQRKLALYWRKCRSPICWDEVGERQILGPELVEQTV
ncbi:hypothetical protein ACDT16_13940, partial [Staphylococcus aureus]